MIRQVHFISRRVSAKAANSLGLAAAAQATLVKTPTMDLHHSAKSLCEFRRHQAFGEAFSSNDATPSSNPSESNMAGSAADVGNDYFRAPVESVESEARVIDTPVETAETPIETLPEEPVETTENPVETLTEEPVESAETPTETLPEETVEMPVETAETPVKIFSEEPVETPVDATESAVEAEPVAGSAPAEFAETIEVPVASPAANSVPAMNCDNEETTAKANEDQDKLIERIREELSVFKQQLVSSLFEVAAKFCPSAPVKEAFSSAAKYNRMPKVPTRVQAKTKAKRTAKKSNKKTQKTTVRRKSTK